MSDIIFLCIMIGLFLFIAAIEIFKVYKFKRDLAKIDERLKKLEERVEELAKGHNTVVDQLEVGNFVDKGIYYGGTPREYQGDPYYQPRSSKDVKKDLKPRSKSKGKR